MVVEVKKSGSGNKMYASQNVIFRVAIVLGMVAAVVTILYLTPVPDQFFKSCDRPCHELDWPMICRAKLVLEPYQAMGNSCLDCPPNSTHCTSSTCPIFPSNNRLPGPTIKVCKNDILVVDVVNRVPGAAVAVHWRGQTQKETPFMDGVPQVTQCPIPSFTTFQYKFRASVAGTHFWHAHSHDNIEAGFYGALIVKQPEKHEEHRKMYDVDDSGHVLMISQNENDLLLNGKAKEEFSVKRSLRYRFRVINAGDCQVTVSVDSHDLKVIALDGRPVTPYEVASFTISAGERIDFVLKATEKVGTYLMRVVSSCEDLKAFGVLKYENLEEKEIKGDLEKISKIKSERIFTTRTCEEGLGRVCLGDVKGLRKMPLELREEVGKKVYLPFDYVDVKQVDGVSRRIHRMNNLTFTYPSSPLLTQLSDVNYKSLCNSLTIPENCKRKLLCECVHIEHIPLDSTVELVLIDQGGEAEEHIFHLHGYSFYVVASRQFEAPLTLEDIKLLDKDNKFFERNVINPPEKDTIRIPRFGVVALRFIARNPGFWILRDELSPQWTRGLDVVFQVGNLGDMVQTPTKFPTCGNWIGPDFFLL